MQTNSRPFPTVTGRCVCNAIRYRLLQCPLFCYACHCPDCQKQSGSAFMTFANIETRYISIISDTKPVLEAQTAKPGPSIGRVVCKQCRTELWGYYSGWGEAVANVRVGTLDYPSLMMPDIHSFVESKVEWVRLPEGARTADRDFDYTQVWPKSSLARLDICLKRFKELNAKGTKEAVEGSGAAAAAAAAAAAVQKKADQSLDGGDVGDEGERTPTGTDVDGEVGADDDEDTEADVDGKDVEDNEAFEKRFRETERALQERLERLSMKLNAEQLKTPQVT